jgi:hypothetical protein
MGFALWTVCALLLFAAARFVPFDRAARWIGELIVALVSAMIFGLLATYFDFGGWNELDWRAGLFVFFGAAAMVGIVRAGVGFRESGVGAGNRSASPPSSPVPKSRVASTPTPHPPLPTPQKQ